VTGISHVALLNLVHLLVVGSTHLRVILLIKGHSGRMLDTTQKKGNHFVETLLPLDYEKEGPILADEIYQTLRCAMPPRATLSCIMNCCHGGSVIHLPYCYAADESASQMYYDYGFGFDALIGLAIFGGILVAVNSAGGNGGGGGDMSGGAGSGASSEGEDGCCGGCCEGLFEGLFDI